MFPRDSRSVEAEDRERRARFERLFGYPPGDLNLEFALLWGMAEGEAVAAERKAIAQGLRESLEIIAQHGLDLKEAMALVVLTHYTDMIRALGEGSNSDTILLPHSPSAVGDIMSQIRDGILIADAAAETNGQPRAIERPKQAA